MSSLSIGRRFAALVLSVVVVVAGSVYAAATPPHASSPAAIGMPALGDTLRLDPLVRAGRLPNGLTYFIRVNHKPEARVALRLAVNVGSTAETDDERGLAHFSEHMNFNGSAHFAPDALVDYLRSIGLRFGADANAFTSFDETIYQLDVPTDRDTLLERGVTVLSDFAGRATLTDTEIEKERGVVLEEWRLGQGAGERISRQQYPVVFHGSKYAERIPIGLPEIIEHAPHERLRAFYHEWYTPDRMAVIAVGDVDPAKMEALIRTHFGDLARPTSPRHLAPIPIPPHAETLFSIATDPEATTSSISLLFERPHRDEVTVADYRHDMIEQLYTSMLNARFSEIAHRAKPPFENAFAGPFSMRTMDGWSLDANVRDGEIEQGFAALLDEVARVRRHGFLATELERAKDRRRAVDQRIFAERDKTESGRFAYEYVNWFLTREPAPGIEAEHALTQRLLDGITLDEVNALTPELIHDDSRVVLVSAPSKAKVPTEAALRAALARAATATPAAWVDATTGRALMTTLPTPGTITSRRSVDEIGATVLTLSNGVEVWLKPTTFKADEILFSGYALGGQSTIDSTDYATAAFASGVLADAGVGGFTSTELQKLLAGKIARAGASYGDYTQGIGGSARPEDLETALQLMYLTFTQPTRDPNGFAALQQRLGTWLADRANDPDAVYGDSVSAVNSGHLYLERTPTVAEVERLSLDKVLAFHRQRFANAADFTFAFAGNFQVDSIAPLIARYLGSLPSQGHRTSTYGAHFPRYPQGTNTVQVRKGMEPKATTRLTFFTTGQPIEELDMHRARACATILNDHLRQKLRELMGGTYTTSVSFGNLLPVPGYATTTVAFGCDPARVDTMIKVTLAEIRALRDQGPSAADLQKDQETERRELEVALQQNGTWTGSILTCLQMGISPARIAHRRERIDLLTVDNLHDTFRKYFPLDRRTTITLLPATGGGTEAGAEPAGK